jgi:hypothetical protein
VEKSLAPLFKGGNAERTAGSCQEILTKKLAVSQETLTKKRALQACFVKKP